MVRGQRDEESESVMKEKKMCCCYEKKSCKHVVALKMRVCREKKGLKEDGFRLNMGTILK